MRRRRGTVARRIGAESLGIRIICRSGFEEREQGRRCRRQRRRQSSWSPAFRVS